MNTQTPNHPSAPTSILLAIATLAHGGAETHVLSLAAELKRRGRRVAVASGGGALVPLLAARGIPHDRLPPLSRSPLALARATLALIRLIRRRRIALVHAHGRLISLPAALACAVTGIPLVTTAHGIYRTSLPDRFLTRWGRCCLAVSREVGRELIRRYRLPQSRIALTVNGIDTERFSPPEGPIPASPLRLIHVSRLDADASRCAHALIAIAPRLKERFPSLQIEIVGGGEEENALRIAALPLPYLTLVGAKTRVEEHLRRAHLFVGVSRAAMEAMACGLPTVLSGNHGTVGLYRAQRAQACIGDNFCCHGGEKGDEALLRALTEALSLSEAERRRAGEEGRRTVLRYLSLSRMGDDAEALYDRAMARRGNRYLLLGYFGAGNCGDEAILAGMLRRLRGEDPTASFTALSSRPRVTAAEHGARAIWRFSPLLPLHLVRARVFCAAGGSLIGDATSRRSLFYYATLLVAARAMGCRVTVRAAGIGPLRSAWSERMARAALSACHEITLRDRRSAQEVERLCGRRCSIEPDGALSLPAPPRGRGEELIRRLSLPCGPYLALALRPLPRPAAGYEDRLAEIIEGARREGQTLLFFLLHPAEDRPLAMRMQRRMGGVILPPLSPIDTEALMSLCERVVAVRLHGAILARRAGREVIGISYDPKTEAYYEEEEGVARVWDVR